MTREEFLAKLFIVSSEDETDGDTSQLLKDHDAEQRQIIDEQVEENRGLRSDVLLMQKEYASQRALIEQQAGGLEELSKENYTLRQSSREMSEAFHKDVTSMKALIEQQATQIAMADHAYQLLAEAHEQQAKKIARLREALADIKRDCEICDWRCPTCGTDYGMRETDLYSYARQALKEEHP